MSPLAVLNDSSMLSYLDSTSYILVFVSSTTLGVSLTITVYLLFKLSPGNLSSTIETGVVSLPFYVADMDTPDGEAIFSVSFSFVENATDFGSSAFGYSTFITVPEGPFFSSGL